MPNFIAGIGLVQSLQQLSQSCPGVHIKVLRKDHPARKMTVTEALTLAKTTAFTGCVADSGKIRFIREVEKPTPEWRECWRTTEAAVLYPSPKPEFFKRV